MSVTPQRDLQRTSTVVPPSPCHPHPPLPVRPDMLAHNSDCFCSCETILLPRAWTAQPLMHIIAFSLRSHKAASHPQLKEKNNFIFTLIITNTERNTSSVESSRHISLGLVLWGAFVPGVAAAHCNKSLCLDNLWIRAKREEGSLCFDSSHSYYNSLYIRSARLTPSSRPFAMTNCSAQLKTLQKGGQRCSFLLLPLSQPLPW